MVYPPPPRRGTDPVRILAWIALVVLVLGVLICGGLLLAPFIAEGIVSGD